jgi:Serine dehydrogenase proteinase
MSRQTRKSLIEQIEAARGTKVVVYVTGDRTPTVAQIGDDALRPLYDHLREIDHTDKLDLFVYSRGGNIDVPWRIATALRSASDRWNLLVPFRANSAATLLGLGADEILMGRHGELGPIDPIMTVTRLLDQPGGAQAMVQDQINVEDIMAYLRFAKERAGLEAQDALSTSLGKLADRLDPVSLGNAYRTHSHIRDLATRMINSRAEPPAMDVIETIVKTLAEQTYAHGHAIGRVAARELGLPVTDAPPEVEQLMWDLLLQYESDMKLLEPLDPVTVTATTDIYTEDAVIALVESAWGVHAFEGAVEVRATRHMPGNLQVALNLNLQAPPGLNPSQEQALQQLLNALQQQLVAQAQQAVQQALQQQAPIAKIDAAFRSGVWRYSA